MTYIIPSLLRNHRRRDTGWLSQVRLLSSCAFRGQGAAPQRSRVDPVGIEGEHPVVEVASRCGLAVHPVEIADISARRVDVAGSAIRVEGAMAYDDRFRVDRGKPGNG